MSHLNVSEAARRLGAVPRDISDLFYKRELRDDLCPVVDVVLDRIGEALRGFIDEVLVERFAFRDFVAQPLCLGRLALRQPGGGETGEAADQAS